MYVYTPCKGVGPCKGQNSISDHLELELERPVNCHMGARNQHPSPLKEQPVFLSAESHPHLGYLGLYFVCLLVILVLFWFC